MGVRGQKSKFSYRLQIRNKVKTRSNQTCSLLSSLFSGKKRKTHSSFFLFTATRPLWGIDTYTKIWMMRRNKPSKALGGKCPSKGTSKYKNFKKRMSWACLKSPRRQGVGKEMRTELYTEPGLLFNCSVVSDSLQSHRLRHARPPCPSPSPG